MNITERHIEMFDRYINGALNTAWKKAFEEKLANNGEFKEAFEQHLLIVKSLKNEGKRSLKEDLIAASVVASGATILKYKSRARRITEWVTCTIVVVAIVVAGLYIYLERNKEPTPKEQPTLPISPVKKGPVKKDKPKKTQQKVSKVEREIFVDTIYQYEYDTVWVAPDSEEAKNAGTTIITETIYQSVVDTVRVE